ncbi:hypothetical protein AYI70_g12067, partial [Smittium culicis]
MRFQNPPNTYVECGKGAQPRRYSSIFLLMAYSRA